VRRLSGGDLTGIWTCGEDAPGVLLDRVFREDNSRAKAGNGEQIRSNAGFIGPPDWGQLAVALGPSRGDGGTVAFMRITGV